MSLSQPSTFVTLSEAQLSAYALCSAPAPENVQRGTTQMRGALSPTSEAPLNGGAGSIADYPQPANIVAAEGMNEEVD